MKKRLIAHKITIYKSKIGIGYEIGPVCRLPSFKPFLIAVHDSQVTCKLCLNTLNKKINTTEGIK